MAFQAVACKRADDAEPVNARVGISNIEREHQNQKRLHAVAHATTRRKVRHLPN